MNLDVQNKDTVPSKVIRTSKQRCFACFSGQSSNHPVHRQSPSPLDFHCEIRGRHCASLLRMDTAQGIDLLHETCVWNSPTLCRCSIFQSFNKYCRNTCCRWNWWGNNSIASPGYAPRGIFFSILLNIVLLFQASNLMPLQQRESWI